MKLPFYAEPGEIQIRSLAVSPHNPHQVLAGSEAGLYRSEDNGMSWDLIESPMAGMQIWSAAWNPADPGVIFAGTKPPGVFRTVDGGKRWEKLPIDIVEKCFAGAPKVTNIVLDPREPKNVWVTVEIDGVFRSRDGGDSWTHLPALGSKVINQDMHGLALSLGNPVKLLATTPDGIWSSIDEGESWSLHGFPKFAERDNISYCRGVAVKPDDPDTIFVANGDFIPGKRGAIHRTRDGGSVGEDGAAGRAQFDHLLVCDQPRQSRDHCGQQPSRVSVPQHRRRRFMDQTAPRVRRNPGAGVAAELKRSTASAERF